MKLIVNADDFGYSKGVNLGIIEAHREGIVTSATMMVNMAGFTHAAGLAKENPGLGVGIHLVLDCGSPVSQEVPSLIDEQGRFRRGQDHLSAANADQLRRELKAQIETFQASGLKLTHIDSHHHVHAHEEVLPIVLQLAEEYELPVRNPWTLTPSEQVNWPQIKTTEGFMHRFYGDDLSVDTLISILDEIDQAGFSTVEMMTHPAFLDEEVLTGSSYNHQRAKELQILTAPQIKEYVQKQKIQLVNFNQLG